jgi:hypothetical protein
VLATSVASGLVVAMIGLPPVFLGPAILVPVYTVAAYRDRPGSLAALAVVATGVAVVQLTPGGTGVATWLGNTLVLAAAWLLGHFVHDRRVYAAQLEQARQELIVIYEMGTERSNLEEVFLELTGPQGGTA